ncbi:MAG: FAD-binding oxidoreductase [Candidatus Spechtbacterales bacterium]
MSKVLTAEVVGRKDLTDDLFILWLAPRTAEKFSFKPGQYCTIGMGGIWRAYSIVSAPHEEHLEFFVELLPDGKLTPLLHKLKVGDSVDLLPRAKGIFIFEPQYKNHVMVATVTGIVPYVSILRDFVCRSLSSGLREEEVGSNFYILHGASYMDEFGYYDELSHLEDTCPLSDMTVIYVPTISRPNEDRNSGWEHQETGRVNIVVEDFLRGTYLRADKTLIYACGHPGMINDVKARLLPKGWKVKEERFWKG